MVKFQFTHSKVREQAFFAKTLIEKDQISKSRGAKALPCIHFPTPMSAVYETNFL